MKGSIKMGLFMEWVLNTLMTEPDMRDIFSFGTERDKEFSIIRMETG